MIVPASTCDAVIETVGKIAQVRPLHNVVSVYTSRQTKLEIVLGLGASSTAFHHCIPMTPGPAQQIKNSDYKFYVLKVAQFTRKRHLFVVNHMIKR